MVELTIQVSHDVAQRLESIHGYLPELLAHIAETLPTSPPATLPLLDASGLADIPPAYTEIINFLTTGPTHQEIIAFKVSTKAQARIRTLLDQNREGTLTDIEQAELDLYEQIEHVMIMLKARAHASQT